MEIKIPQLEEVSIKLDEVLELLKALPPKKAPKKKKEEAASEPGNWTTDDVPNVPQPMPEAPPTLTQAPIAPAIQESVPQAQPVPTAPVAPAYDFPALSIAMSQLLDSKGMEVVQSIMAQFRIPALTSLPVEQYDQMALAIRANGGNI